MLSSSDAKFFLTKNIFFKIFFIIYVFISYVLYFKFYIPLPPEATAKVEIFAKIRSLKVGQTFNLNNFQNIFLGRIYLPFRQSLFSLKNTREDNRKS